MKETVRDSVIISVLKYFFYDNLNKGESHDSSNNTFFTGRKLTKGEKSFEVKELEVFKIVYI